MHWILRPHGDPERCKQIHLGELKSGELKKHVNLLQIFRGWSSEERGGLNFAEAQWLRRQNKEVENERLRLPCILQLQQ